MKRKEVSFCNCTRDSGERWEMGKLSFPRLLPKDSMGQGARVMKRSQKDWDTSSWPQKRALGRMLCHGLNFKTVCQRER